VAPRFAVLSLHSSDASTCHLAHASLISFRTRTKPLAPSTRPAPARAPVIAMTSGAAAPGNNPVPPPPPSNPTPTGLSQPAQPPPVPSQTTLPPNKRDLKSWWRGFKLQGRHQDSQGTDPYRPSRQPTKSRPLCRAKVAEAPCFFACIFLVSSRPPSHVMRTKEVAERIARPLPFCCP
jgi:hypothetical protein